MTSCTNKVKLYFNFAMIADNEEGGSDPPPMRAILSWKKKKEKCSNYNVFSNALQQKLQLTNGMKKWVQLFSWRTLYTQGKLSIVDVRRDTKCRYIVSKNNSNTITERVFSECHNSPFAHLSKSITEDRATASFRKEKQTNKQKQRVE